MQLFVVIKIWNNRIVGLYEAMTYVNDQTNTTHTNTNNYFNDNKKKLIDNLPKKLNFPKTIIRNPSAMTVENPNSLFFFEKLKIFAQFSENIYILRDKK